MRTLLNRLVSNITLIESVIDVLIMAVVGLGAAAGTIYGFVFFLFAVSLGWVGLCWLALLIQRIRVPEAIPAPVTTAPASGDPVPATVARPRHRRLGNPIQMPESPFETEREHTLAMLALLFVAMLSALGMYLSSSLSEGLMPVEIQAILLGVLALIMLVIDVRIFVASLPEEPELEYAA